MRRIDLRRQVAQPSPSRLAPTLPEESWWPDARWPENAKERAKLLALKERLEQEEKAGRTPEKPVETEGPRNHSFVEDGGGWRPGARWAKDAGSDQWLDQRLARKRAQKAAILAQIETLPLHQRPPVRELGRRSESLPHPFRPAPGDEAGPPSRPAYDLEGAFWQQGRTLGGFVARAVGSAVLQAEKNERAEAGEPPMVVTERVGQRVVLAHVCSIAEALGLCAGMPLTQARALVPNLVIRPADPEGVAADLNRLARHAARHWTPQVSIVPGEGLLLDISASAHLFDGEERLARRIVELCRRLGLVAHVAVADTAAAAQALAQFSSLPVTISPAGQALHAIEALPVSGLRLGDDAKDTARRLGLDTIGRLAAIPRAAFVRRFGREVSARLDEALGTRAQPIDQLVPVELPTTHRCFAEPLLTAEPIARALDDLTVELCGLLAARHQGARRVSLTLTRIDAVDQNISIGLARPSRDADHIMRLTATRLDQIEPGFGIEAMRLVAERVDPLTPQPVPSNLLAEEQSADLACLIDRLAVRLGWRRLFRFAAAESDVPERSVRRIDPTAIDSSGWSRWPRPSRMLDPPEPVEGVLALLPDGVPRRFVWRGRAYQIVRGDGPERIHGEWWRSPAERDAVRDYFQVEDVSGGRFWLFRRGDAIDGSTGDLSWHLHGVFG